MELETPEPDTAITDSGAKKKMKKILYPET
jgi:hypothetical protein